MATKVATSQTVAIQSEIQAKDYKRLPESQTDFARLRTLPQDSKRLQNHGRL